MFGVGGRFVYEVDEVLRRLGWTVAAYVVNRPEALRPSDLSPLVDAVSLSKTLTELPAVIPLGTPAHRAVAVREARAYGFDFFPAVVDPTAIVASSATVAGGVFLNAGAIIAARAKLGDHAVINRGASVGHDSTVGECSFLGPGAILCGGVLVGGGAFVGAGAVVNPDVRIGTGSVVGSGSVVTRDVPSHALVLGNPARVVTEPIEAKAEDSASTAS